MSKLFTFIGRGIARKTVFATAVLVASFIFVYLYSTKSGGIKTPLIPVGRGTIVQEVTVTGTTKPVESVDLAFEKSGKVTGVRAKVGDTVTARQILVVLDQSELRAQLLQAQANVQSERAKLLELQKGTRTEDLKITRTELEKARQDLADAYSNVLDVLNDAYVKANDAVRNQTNGIFLNSEDVNPQLTFLTNDSQTKTNIELQRSIMSLTLNKWRSELDKLTPASLPQTLDATVQSGVVHLGAIRTFLGKVLDVVINTTSLSQTTVSTYKTSLNTGLTNVNTALSSVNGQTQSISSQKITAQKIEDELNLKLAGSSEEEIAAQEARVSQAEANVQIIEAQIGKTILTSPIEGTVTKQNAKLGEIVSPNVSIVSIVSENKLEIEANVPEADIIKVKIGNNAKVTLDAFGNDVFFDGVVVSIDPGETVLEGVATYKTTLQFLREDERMKTGMTANIDILTQKKEGVLVIPQRVVMSRNGRNLVTMSNPDGTTTEKEIQVGLRGSDGTIEVVSGLQEGDKLVGL